jgi:hypothetical protein
MILSVIEKIGCDICKTTTYSDNLEGWIYWSEEKSRYDNDWIKRHLCPKCASNVKDSLAI